MQFRNTRVFFAWVALCLSLVWAGSTAFAQSPPQVRTIRAGDYVRLSFTWPTPTSMRVSEGGTQVQAQFSSPVPTNISAAAPGLAPYVLGISRSADGKAITIALNDRHKVRHFISGNNTGIDIMAALAPEPKEPPKPPPAPAESKPTEPKPTPKPPAPAPVKTAPAPKSPLAQIKPRTDSVLSTKPKPAAKPAPAPKPAPKPETTKPETKTAPKPVPPKPTSKLTTAPAKTAVPAISKPIAPKDDGTPVNLKIGVIPGETGPTLQFPWPSRTSLAAFTRNGDIWLVFGRDSIIDMARLKRILPSPLIQVVQFRYPGYTVLRLRASTALYPSVNGSRDNYQLDIQFKDKPTKALNPIEITPGTDSVGPHILFKLFDVSSPVTFYDPDIGDRWMVVPSFEVGRGNEQERIYPGIRVLETSQGLVINTKDDTAMLKRTRAGLRLTRAGGLALSKTLPFLSGQVKVAGTNALTKDIVLANDRYFVPGADLAETRRDIMNRLVRAVDVTSRANLLRQLAGMYVTKGFGPEASTILTEIRNLYRNYYNEEKLAIMHTAAAFLSGRMKEAAFYLKDDAIAKSTEAQLWRDAIGLFANVAEGEAENPEEGSLEAALNDAGVDARLDDKDIAFDYLAYDAKYLQYYPAILRQKLSLVAADRYIQNGQTNNALTVFDRLDEDGILKPVQPYAEYLFGKVAADKGNVDTAMRIWKELIARNEDRYINARAEFALITLEYAQKITDLDETIKRLNAMRIDWRGDDLERELLEYLGERYIDAEAYDEAMRTWKELLNAFPLNPKTLQIRRRMAALFEELFTHGLADKMEPLRSLALFYEFRNLTPIGDRGNRMVQKLAERLASVDLLDRAIELLDHQVRKRVEGKERASVGAQLALLHIINGAPQKALETLELSNYGQTGEELRQLRLQLNAQALADDKRPMDAINVLRNDRSPKGRQLGLDILWQMQDWPNIINHAEDMLAMRKDLTAPLTEAEEEILIQLALAYSFERDFAQLSYLRDFYLSLMDKERQYRDVFDYLTNDTSPLDTEDVALLTRQISRTRSFLRELREEVSKGNLNEAVPQQ